jgi:lipoprotein NlpD
VSQAAQSNDSRQSPTQESKSTDAKRDDQKANSDSRTTSTSPDTKDQDSLNSAKPAVNTDIEWIWPADGKAVSTFSGGKGGIRIEGQSGDPILAIGDGKVIFAGQGPKGYGNLLIVRHEGELLSVYAHNRALLVQEGSQVKRGQKIAEMGDSGADRTQLGFELRRNGRPVDPRSALPQR